MGSASTGQYRRLDSKSMCIAAGKHDTVGLALICTSSKSQFENPAESMGSKTKGKSLGV